MMDTASVVEIGRPSVRRDSIWRSFRGPLKGSEYTWALAFVVPYIAVFVTFVAYPVVYGLWVGSEPRLYPELDRKSTRLNSSHTVISYAVFCLKKKKQ